jgi:single-strand DNA-binding protein
MFNKIILHGRLVRDPESFATTSGKNICKFTVANSRKFNDKEDVIFIECKVFGSKGDACFRYLKKGSECIVAGILTTEKWTGKDGQEKQKNSILAEEVEFIGRPPQSEPQQPQYLPQQAQYQQPPAYQQRQPLAQPVQAAITEAIKQQEAQQQPDTIDDDIPF